MGYVTEFLRLFLSGVDLPGHETKIPNLISHRSHVNAVPIIPLMLEILLQLVLEWIFDLVELDELSYAHQLVVVPGSSGIQALDDSRHIPKY